MNASARVPWWVSGLDILGAAATLLAGVVALLGRFSIGYGGIHVRVGDPALLAVTAAGALVIRHLLRPSPSLYRRIAASVGEGVAGASARAASVACGSRLAVLLLGYLAVVAIGVSAERVGFQVSSDPLLDLPARFDAGWYLGIADEGYAYRYRVDVQQNIAFFPAFPMAMRVVGPVVGTSAQGLPPSARRMRLLWAGVLISVVAFVWAAGYLARFAGEELGEERAVSAVALLAAYPFAVFFSAPYTESLFLLGSVAAAYHFKRAFSSTHVCPGQGAAPEMVPADAIKAALWGALVGLTRPNGFVLSAPLGLIAMTPLVFGHRRPVGRASAWALVVAAMPTLGMLAHTAYVYQLTGTWFTWAKLHAAWGRSLSTLDSGSLLPRWESAQGLLRGVAADPYSALNGLAVVFVVALAWAVWRRLGLPWFVYLCATIVPPLLAGGVLSMGRITSTLFPVFIVLAGLLSRTSTLALLTAFAALQGLAAALFFTWRPLY